MLDARLAALKADTHAALLRIENKMDRTSEKLSTEISLAHAHTRVELDKWMVLMIGWLASAAGALVTSILTGHRY